MSNEIWSRPDVIPSFYETYKGKWVTQAYNGRVGVLSEFIVYYNESEFSREAAQSIVSRCLGKGIICGKAVIPDEVQNAFDNEDYVVELIDIGNTMYCPQWTIVKKSEKDITWHI